MLALADDVVVGYTRAGGMLDRLLQETLNKPVSRLVP